MAFLRVGKSIRAPGPVVFVCPVCLAVASVLLLDRRHHVGPRGRAIVVLAHVAVVPSCIRRSGDALIEGAIATACQGVLFDPHPGVGNEPHCKKRNGVVGAPRLVVGGDDAPEQVAARLRVLYVDREILLPKRSTSSHHHDMRVACRTSLVAFALSGGADLAAQAIDSFGRSQVPRTGTSSGVRACFGTCGLRDRDEQDDDSCRGGSGPCQESDRGDAAFAPRANKVGHVNVFRRRGGARPEAGLA